MKLYTGAMPPNPRRINQFIQYKGIEIDTTLLDMGKAEQLSAEYKAINPLGTIPALVLDDGTLMTEVLGICLYLESQYPEKPLMGAPGLEQAKVVSAIHQVYVNGFQPVAEALRNGSENFAGRALPGPLALEQIPALVDRGHERLGFFYQTMEDRLADRDFLVGDKLTQADIDLRVVCDFAAIVKHKVPENCPSLRAHQARISDAIPL